MSNRPTPRDCRADARTALTRWLRHTDAPNPDSLAGELLVVLDGARLGLTDLTLPEDPNADPLRRITDPIPAAAPQPSPGLAEYRAARGKTDPTTQEGP